MKLWIIVTNDLVRTEVLVITESPTTPVRAKRASRAIRAVRETTVNPSPVRMEARVPIHSRTLLVLVPLDFSGLRVLNRISVGQGRVKTKVHAITKLRSSRVLVLENTKD